MLAAEAISEVQPGANAAGTSLRQGFFGQATAITRLASHPLTLTLYISRLTSYCSSFTRKAGNYE
jgi:hypothetical protein